MLKNPQYNILPFWGLLWEYVASLPPLCWSYGNAIKVLCKEWFLPLCTTKEIIHIQNVSSWQNCFISFMDWAIHHLVGWLKTTFSFKILQECVMLCSVCFYTQQLLILLSQLKSPTVCPLAKGILTQRNKITSEIINHFDHYFLLSISWKWSHKELALLWSLHILLARWCLQGTSMLYYVSEFSSFKGGIELLLYMNHFSHIHFSTIHGITTQVS